MIIELVHLGDYNFSMVTLLKFQDSYVFSHFKAMDRFLSVGPPVFFVIKGDLEYSDRYEQNKICSGAGCAPDSLGAQVARAARWSNR